MVDLKVMVSYVGVATVLAFTPGPDILYVLTRGIAQGRRVALAAAMGFGLGNLVHTFFAVAGLSALLAASPKAYAAVRYAGAIYLVYLGLRMLLDRSGLDPTAGGPQKEAGAVFRQSIVANVLNPKVAVFFVAFLPQFVDRQRGLVWLQLVILGVTFMLTAMVCFSLVALASGWIGERLQRAPGVGRVMRILAGVVLIGLGAMLAWPSG